MSFLLFLVAAVAGALNSVAGGGSFLTLPTLLYAGVTPVVANATSTMAMWPGSVASAVAYRRELQRRAALARAARIVSLVGGFLGGVLLVRTSDTSFMRLLPWLMLLAAVTFTFGDGVRRTLSLEHLHGNVWLVAATAVRHRHLRRLFRRRHGHHDAGDVRARRDDRYPRDERAQDAAGRPINVLALVEFIVKGIVAWGPGLIMVAGAIVGGYFGAVLARRIDPVWIRGLSSRSAGP